MNVRRDDAVIVLVDNNTDLEDIFVDDNAAGVGGAVCRFVIINVVECKVFVVGVVVILLCAVAVVVTDENAVVIRSKKQ